MKLQLEPLSSSFNPYFYVIIGKTNKALLMLTWSLQKVSFQWFKADLQDYFRLISSPSYLSVDFQVLKVLLSWLSSLINFDDYSDFLVGTKMIIK